MIGIDLGGTNVRVAEVHPDGTLGVHRQAPIDRSDVDGPPFGQLVAMLDNVATSLRPREVDGVGLSVTGPVDVQTGWVDNPFTLPPSMQGDLLGALEAGFSGPVAIENDANAAALGEARFGAGRDGEVVVCVTVGTGIGVGVVAHGRLLAGAGGAHPEAGHLVVDPTGPDCYCGASGCVESLASASAIERAAIAGGIVGIGSSAHDVFTRAFSGDERARSVIDRAWAALAAGIRTLTAVYAPDVVVLAGGARGEGTALSEFVSRELAGFPFGAAGVVVRPAALGDWAGCIGAASLVMPPQWPT